MARLSEARRRVSRAGDAVPGGGVAYNELDGSAALSVTTSATQSRSGRGFPRRDERHINPLGRTEALCAERAAEGALRRAAEGDATRRAAEGCRVGDGMRCRDLRRWSLQKVPTAQGGLTVVKAVLTLSCLVVSRPLSRHDGHRDCCCFFPLASRLSPTTSSSSFFCFLPPRCRRHSVTYPQKDVVIIILLSAAC